VLQRVVKVFADMERDAVEMDLVGIGGEPYSYESARKFLGRWGHVSSTMRKKFLGWQ
jgi:hypothetical protein